LGNNFLSDFESLKPLGKSTADTLERVDLSANPVSEVSGYRDFMFEMLPMLQVLDGLDRSGVEDYADILHDLDEVPGGHSKLLTKPEDALKPQWMQERELEDRLINNPRRNTTAANEEDDEDEDEEDDEEDDDDYA
jgi:acidic leucine-rich nuclear phosphoprotein 32 family protein B